MRFIITLKVLIISTALFSQQTVEWSLLNLDEPSDQYTRTISVVDTNIIWGALSEFIGNGEMVFRTIDGGQNFDVSTIPVTFSSGWVADIIALDENTAYTATTNSSGSQIYGIHRTTDGGLNWDLVFENSEEEFTALKVHFFNPSDGFIYGASQPLEGGIIAGFYYTEDGGDTWIESDSAFPVTRLLTEGGNDGFAVVGDTVWCANVPDRIFYSYDKGHTWNASSNIGNDGDMINDIAFKNSSEGLAISSYSESSFNTLNTLYETSDGGVTWTILYSLGLLSTVVNAHNLAYIPGTEGAYIITSGEFPINNREFLFTLDNGNTWEEGLTSYPLTTVEFLSPTIGFGGSRIDDSGSGLLKYNDDIFSVATSVNELETANSDFQVYPNPVFATATVSIENDWYGDLQVQIVDLLGHEVFRAKTEKVNRSMVQEFDVSDLPAGRYNLLLSTEEKTTTSTFVKMR